VPAEQRDDARSDSLHAGGGTTILALKSGTDRSYSSIVTAPNL
jgi:hypothetical protein